MIAQRVTARHMVKLKSGILEIVNKRIGEN